MSLCFIVAENLNFGDFFHTLVLFTDYSRAFWYSFSFLFTSNTLLEIIVFIYWLQLFSESMSYSYVTCVVSGSFDSAGIIATSFFTQTFKSSVDFELEI